MDVRAFQGEEIGIGEGIRLDAARDCVVNGLKWFFFFDGFQVFVAPVTF